MSVPLALDLAGIGKSFGGAPALADGSLAVRRGTVHGVVGPNGAGKSTLLKIASGQLGPDSGSIAVNGVERRFRTPADALNAGIAAMPQELCVVGDLSVEENVVLGREPASGGWVRGARRRRAAREALERVGIDLPLRAAVGSLEAGEQRVVMLARALHAGAHALILDEPTAALTAQQAQMFMRVVESLRGQDVAVVYVSHRFAEVVRLSDEVTVLRDGASVATMARPEITAEALVDAVVRRGAVDERPDEVRRAGAGRVALRARGLHGRQLRGVGLDLRAGEVVGVCGLPGAGAEELLEVLGGARRPLAGEMTLDGARLAPAEPADAVARGVAYLPAERARAGLLDLAIRENVLVSDMSAVARYGVVTARAERAAAKRALEGFGLDPRVDEPLRSLSGGNRQKVLLTRCLEADAAVVVLGDPTVGVDVGARAEIHALLARMAADGLAIAVSSSETEELVAIADRVSVLVRGRIVAELAGEALDVSAVTRAMTVDAGEVPAR